MLGADGLNLALMIADSGIIDSAVNDLMARSQVMSLTENRGVRAKVKNHLLKWRGTVKKRITNVCETERFQQELACIRMSSIGMSKPFSITSLRSLKSSNGTLLFI